MGEFSAGKSTLSNLLLGSDPLPMRVTATRLPPVWIASGAAAARRVDHAGAESALDDAGLAMVDPADTRLIRLFLDADVLDLCDLIDFPGISAPNMPAEAWLAVIDEVDAVIWCTHATQAWRQSEAAFWEALSPRIGARSLLLVTQIDKLANARDRDRVMARLARETDGLFAGRYAISLTEALKAGEDGERWAQSGAAAFTEALVDMLLGIETAPAAPRTGVTHDDDMVLPRRVRNRPGDRLRTRPVDPACEGRELRAILAATGETT
jgi:hypothetical protein